ncbi:hypothetical protein Hanom_Chr13g01204161 [Helianthus anomalus]
MKSKHLKISCQHGPSSPSVSSPAPATGVAPGNRPSLCQRFLPMKPHPLVSEPAKRHPPSIDNTKHHHHRPVVVRRRK